MQCANELFYAKGYDAVGVQEIVERAGLTKPTLYYYFGSKLGLLEALLETKFSVLRRPVRLLLEDETGIHEALYRLANIFCDFYEADQRFYMLLMALFYSAQENEAYQVVKPYIQEFYETVVQVFEHAADQLGNMNGRQRQFAIGFVGTVNHFILLHRETCQGHQEFIDRQQITAVVNQFMYGIFS